MMNKIVSEIVDVLLSLPEGTELATSDVIKQLYGHEYLTLSLIHIYNGIGIYSFILPFATSSRNLSTSFAVSLDLP